MVVERLLSLVTFSYHLKMFFLTMDRVFEWACFVSDSHLRRRHLGKFFRLSFIILGFSAESPMIGCCLRVDECLISNLQYVSVAYQCLSLCERSPSSINDVIRSSFYACLFSCLIASLEDGCRKIIVSYDAFVPFQNVLLAMHKESSKGCVSCLTVIYLGDT